MVLTALQMGLVYLILFIDRDPGNERKVTESDRHDAIVANGIPFAPASMGTSTRINPRVLDSSNPPFDFARNRTCSMPVLSTSLIHGDAEGNHPLMNGGSQKAL